MLNKTFTYENPSKNSSFIRKGFPSLSHKPSESIPKEKILDLGFLPHWNDTLSITDCSSAGRFFKPVEIGKTTRATSHSFRMPKVLKERETYLAKTAENGKRSEINQIWEITERVDSCKIRTENKNFLPKTISSVNEEFELWKKCSFDVGMILKQQNFELFNSFSVMNSNIFAVFEDLKEIFKATESAFKENLQELNFKIKTLQKEVLVLQQKNSETLVRNKLAELEIKKEVDEMFPSSDEEVKKLKEDSFLSRQLKESDLAEILSKLYVDMNQDWPMPEVSNFDLSGMSADELINELRENYRFVISTTVKSVKTSIESSKKKTQKQETQTDGDFVEISQYENLQKLLEKEHLLYQSALMQLENSKEDNMHKSRLLEGLESEKTQNRYDSSQVKREKELIFKEVTILRGEIEVKKNEIGVLAKMNSDKTTKIESLQGRVEELLEKVSDLTYVLERSNRIKTPKPDNDEKVLVKTVVVEEIKKNSLDEVGKSGLTVREELEKAYADKLSVRKPRNLVVNEVNVKKDEEDVKNTNSQGVKSEKGMENTGNMKIIEENGKNQENQKGKVENNKVNEKNGGIIEKNTRETEKNTRMTEKNIKATEKNSENSRETLGKSQERTEKAEKTKEPEWSKRENLSKLDLPKEEELLEKITYRIPKFDSDEESAEEMLQQVKPKKSEVKPIKKTTMASKPPSNSEKPRNSQKKPTNLEKPSKHLVSPVKSNDPSPTFVQNSPKPRQKYVQKFNHMKTSSLEPSQILSQDSLLQENTEMDLTSQGISISNYKDPSEEPSNESNSISPHKDFKNQDIPSSFQNSSIKKTLTYCDKQSGRDIAAEISIGVQVDLYHPEVDSTKGPSGHYFLPYNPNNIYGLRGDVYYQKSSFMPQARIPDLASSVIFQPAYKYS